MSIQKNIAFRALGQKIRKQYGLSFDESALLSDAILQPLLKSSPGAYKSFAEAYSGGGGKPGGHPDYNYLAEQNNIGKTEEGEIATFFLDLKNFTKYCRFLSEDKVYVAKAATISAVTSVCLIYGGHLHEIPGDGVLVFFGRKGQESLHAAGQALLAACDSMAFLEEEIIPEYNNDDRYPDIYPKMGIDFGKALWGAYGSDPQYEVKATSFNVDVASKMMQQCNDRQVSIGDDFRTFLDVEDDYLERGWVYEKSLTVEGEEKRIKYQTWLFDWRLFRNKKMNSYIDLAKLGMTIGGAPAILGSKSKLGDAPLA